ncbi:MAG: PDZ domain-containing protein [Proteobacteria bacterium]|nr:PDZ domain-containing protein [Pseudomonadota bacterium]
MAASSLTLRNAWDDEPIDGGRQPDEDMEIVLEKGPAASFGFTVGINELSREVQITKVSAAPAFGRLLRDDCVVSIDNVAMRGLTHEQVVSCIKGRSRITLVVRRSPVASRSERRGSETRTPPSSSRPQSMYSGGRSGAQDPKRRSSGRPSSLYDPSQDGDVIVPPRRDPVLRQSLTPESYSALGTRSTGRRDETPRHRVLPTVPQTKVCCRVIFPFHCNLKIEPRG